uniref:Uncharacterized protein n=1 Tax=Triticum urartu TaxID=4572 RepID=A0A8R7U648_TRIUA
MAAVHRGQRRLPPLASGVRGQHRHRDWSTPSVHLDRRLPPSPAPDPTTAPGLSIVLQAHRQRAQEEVVLLGSSTVSVLSHHHHADAPYTPMDLHLTRTGGFPPPRWRA